MAFAGVCWCLLVSDGVFQCPMVSGDLRRVSEELLKGYLCAVYVFMFKVWVRPREHLSVQALFGAACFVLENLRKAKFHTPGFFETTKYQNLPI